MQLNNFLKSKEKTQCNVSGGGDNVKHTLNLHGWKVQDLQLALYKANRTTLWNQLTRGCFQDHYNLVKSRVNFYLPPDISINYLSLYVTLSLKWLLSLIESRHHCKKKKSMDLARVNQTHYSVVMMCEISLLTITG